MLPGLHVEHVLELFVPAEPRNCCWWLQNQKTGRAYSAELVLVPFVLAARANVDLVEVEIDWGVVSVHATGMWTPETGVELEFDCGWSSAANAGCAGHQRAGKPVPLQQQREDLPPLQLEAIHAMDKTAADLYSHPGLRGEYGGLDCDEETLALELPWSSSVIVSGNTETGRRMIAHCR